ncbi:mechanosensitive ion channel family protein [Mangrovibacterium marinum]|uniref:Mechanosensitive ion channel-like protein n=1 Tax=Mangrovibacterium marinum TaxID=1639118 RepID=A0A2T5C3Q7_9BACT|nr:mechanosensitive ion channel domain-containing protein [Mangrovibacterium marinum]PTN09394.1 mechanosensitive ion channel-like protein [Mangrovibacterium marinum]
MKEIIVLHGNNITVTLFQLVVSVSILISGIILTIALNRLVLRFGSKNMFDAKFIRFVRQGIRVTSTLLVLALILDVLHINYHQVLDQAIFSNKDYKVTVKSLIGAIIVIYITRMMTYALDFWMNRRIIRKRMDRGRGKSFGQIMKYLVWLLGLSIIASSLGLNMTFVIASISALLIGVGFGLQHIFNDFFSGIIILFDGSIKVDDIVEVEGTIGRVLTIGLRFSKVLTRDNVVIIVPNSRFTTEKVINWTHNMEATRFHVNVGVAYGSNVQLVKQILLAAASQHQEIVQNPKPFVRFNDFGESSLDFQLYFWTVSDFLVENIKSDLRFVIDDEFRKQGVEIPFPQRDLHLRSKSFE